MKLLFVLYVLNTIRALLLYIFNFAVEITRLNLS